METNLSVETMKTSIWPHDRAFREGVRDDLQETLLQITHHTSSERPLNQDRLKFL